MCLLPVWTLADGGLARLPTWEHRQTSAYYPLLYGSTFGEVGWAGALEGLTLLSEKVCLLHGGATHGQHATVRSRLQYAHRSVAPSIELRRPVARWENTTHTSSADGGK